MNEARPLLIHAAAVHSCDAPAAAADAVLVRGSRIAAVGRRDELRRSAPDARLLDLSGTVLTPGLTDAHVHLTEWALGRRDADLADTDSPAAAVATLRAHQHPPAGWIRGRGWNPHRWQGQEPTRAPLDHAFPNRPVALQSHDMHALWVNGAALRAAGITAATADPPGGRIVRDDHGDPTGLLLETAGELVIGVLPVPTASDVADAVAAAQPALHGFGITGVHSFPGIALPEPDPLEVLQLLRERGRLRLRVLQHIRADRLEHAIALGLRSGFGDAWLRIGGIKLFLDGALGSRTAWLREPYEGSAARGVCVLPEPEFRAIACRATAAGLALTVHAIGDAAVSLALDVLGDPALPRPALPHRIEHVQCCPAERLGDAGRAGIIASVQPCHLISDWRAADRHWGPQRARHTYAFASLERGGAVLAFGSDAPVEPIDPRRSLYAAVQRQDLVGEPAGGWYADERLDALSALRAFTAGPALAAGAAGDLGVLAPGALADLVAWDRDPLRCEPAELLSLRAVATVIDGELVND